MNKNELIRKLKEVKTKPALDALRMDCVEFTKPGKQQDFADVQAAFRKAANRVRRVPLKDRTW